MVTHNLKNKGINMSISKLKVGDDGKIKQIKIKVVCKDGTKGEFWTANFERNDKIYIIRNDKTPFCIGDCAEFEEK